MNTEQVLEHTGVAEGQLVMPFYIVCDVSLSMTGDMPELNTALRNLRTAIVAEPAVDDVARIAVLTFSSSANVVTPLNKLSEGQMPMLSEQGGTNYGAAFRLLAQTIEEDGRRLKQEGYKPYRPCAFFLTDGEPQDGDWASSFASTLTYDKETGQGMKWHPIFVPFGFRDADEGVLARLAYPPKKSRWFLARTTSAAQALDAIRDIILKTIVSSGQRANNGQAGALALPAPDPGSGVASGASAYESEFM